MTMSHELEYKYFDMHTFPRSITVTREVTKIQYARTYCFCGHSSQPIKHR